LNGRHVVENGRSCEGLTLYCGCVIRHLIRDRQGVVEMADALIPLAKEQGFPYWLAMATILRGWALSEAGESERGIAEVAEGLTAFRDEMWATIVDRDGRVCAVTFSGDNRSAQWPGSRVISANVSRDVCIAAHMVAGAALLALWAKSGGTLAIGSKAAGGVIITGQLQAALAGGASAGTIACIIGSCGDC
jgi:hypothetical protein